jgi:chromosome transmission fidelity protein 1
MIEYDEDGYRGFPMTPYPQQVLLMEKIEETLNVAKSNGKPTLAMLESPTGTGKTMSIICSVMNWMELQTSSMHKKKNKDMKSNELDWVLEFEEKQVKEHKLCITSDSDQEVDHEEGKIRLIYSSRTHSQISQFVNEIKRTRFAKSMTSVSLGSRANLCINERVRNSAIPNEKCLDLLGSGKSSDLSPDSKKRVRNSNDSRRKSRINSSCPYLKSSLTKFSQKAVSSIHDIEELSNLGREMQICPYYGSRNAASYTDVVTLPYPSLLQKSTRESLGVTSLGNIVIIDEAHNILDSINEIHSCLISLSQAEDVQKSLERYFSINRNRFKNSNALDIKRLLFISKQLYAFLSSLSSSDSEKIFSVNEFLSNLNIDNYNLFQLGEFITEFEIFKKIRGFQPEGQDSIGSSVFTFSQFLNALTNANSDGRIVCYFEPNPCVKFLMLNASTCFEAILKDAFAVILLGGTMKPFELYQSQLLQNNSLKDVNIVNFSCDHVISPDNLVCRILKAGPSGKSFLFNFTTRNDEALVEELGRSILNFCNVVPGGVVCFFASYDTEQSMTSVWIKRQIFEKINQKKPIFRESKGNKLGEEDVLGAYSNAIASNPLKGAILFCVVGGKLSEGINFSNDLARCVFLIGMPYANKNSSELKEKMKYIDSIGKSSQEFYQNLCMRAVNQSIGRAIRHKNDYASIILVDERYSQPRNFDHLPSWILRSTKVSENYAHAFRDVREFFKNRSKVECSSFI